MKKGNGFFAEFKKFILRGNVIDLAVGVIIGGAFSGIVTSLVTNIVTPLISILTGKIAFADLFIALDGKEYATLEAATEAGASTVNYGLFVVTRSILGENDIVNENGEIASGVIAATLPRDFSIMSKKKLLSKNTINNR